MKVPSPPQSFASALNRLANCQWNEMTQLWKRNFKVCKLRDFYELNESHCHILQEIRFVMMSKCDSRASELSWDEMKFLWFAFAFSQCRLVNINFLRSMLEIQNMKKDKTHVGANKWLNGYVETALYPMNAKSSVQLFTSPYDSARTSPFHS